MPKALLRTIAFLIIYGLAADFNLINAVYLNDASRVISICPYFDVDALDDPRMWYFRRREFLHLPGRVILASHRSISISSEETGRDMWRPNAWRPDVDA